MRNLRPGRLRFLNLGFLWACCVWSPEGEGDRNRGGEGDQGANEAEYGLHRVWCPGVLVFCPVLKAASLFPLWTPHFLHFCGMKGFMKGLMAQL